MSSAGGSRGVKRGPFGLRTWRRATGNGRQARPSLSPATRYMVLGQEGGQRGPGAEPVAAGNPGRRTHRIAQRAESHHVVADGPGADLQPLRQVGAGPISAGLEKS